MEKREIIDVDEIDHQRISRSSEYNRNFMEADKNQKE